MKRKCEHDFFMSRVHTEMNKNIEKVSRKKDECTEMKKFIHIIIVVASKRLKFGAKKAFIVWKLNLASEFQQEMW